MSIYLVLLPILSLILWVVPPFLVKAIYLRRYQGLNEAIKRRDLAIRAIVKNPDEYASIGQVERVTDLIGELKEQIAQEDSVLLEISSKLEQTQRYVEEQERSNGAKIESDTSNALTPVEAERQPDSTNQIIRLAKDQLESLKTLRGEFESSLLTLTNTPSLKSLESDEDRVQLELLRQTLEASKTVLEKVNDSVVAS